MAEDQTPDILVPAVETLPTQVYRLSDREPEI